jgi:UDP-N-acetyl-D-glucosamine dehydrogenase
MTGATKGHAAAFRDGLSARTLKLGVIGLGYVGLPLARAAWRRGFSIVGFDIDTVKVDCLNRGQSYIQHIPARDIEEMRRERRFEATTDYGRLTGIDAIVICVPTPLSRNREPDLSYLIQTAEAIAPYLRPGQLVALQSTTYPGTTREALQVILERGGLKCGTDFFLAFSPEREDPGNEAYDTETIPKIVGADDEESLALAVALYGAIVDTVVPVSSAATAEAVKLTENIFRSVNIALVNELKILFEKMGIDIWEVIDAAKTKPFGFMPFYPGPGLGGHCIPIDPFYLTWKAREFDMPTRFIELAGEINAYMPLHVVQRIRDELDARYGRGLNGARILVIGVSYKRNVDDMRESPSLKIMDILRAKGSMVIYHDPFIPVIRPTREHGGLTGMRSVDLAAQRLADMDAAVICTDHGTVDYDALVRHSRLIVDTRNATRDVKDHRERIVKA